MSLLVLDNSNQNTFQPMTRKNEPVKTKGSQLGQLTTMTLGDDILREAVRLPVGEDINEWFAMHIDDFFININMLYGASGVFCTNTTCPVMNARGCEYEWADGDTAKTPIMVSAPKYVEHFLDWIGAQTENDNIFPKELDEPFPPNFKDVVKDILKRMFPVYAHMYCTHFPEVKSLGMELHLNICFTHLVCFITEYQLINKAELVPLQDVVKNIVEPQQALFKKMKEGF